MLSSFLSKNPLRSWGITQGVRVRVKVMVGTSVQASIRRLRLGFRVRVR